jgi:hypothetical protein
VTNVHDVVGVFRHRGQARHAAAAAQRKGWHTPAPDALVEDADGVHVILHTTGAPEDARQLLLDYGAYSASMS